MHDNPLIGEYTKGISCGSEYFRKLVKRAYREKAPLRVISTDLASPWARIKQAHLPKKEAASAEKLSKLLAHFA